ncbi:MAG TPA: alkaline phosphatase D family protein [Agriterribacter sp.]|nr:alkaline phosphatase D family protein [Agriterribacter sp.]
MKRRKFIFQASLGVGGLLPVINKIQELEGVDGPFFSTGIKIGEISATEAIIWARVTRDAIRVGKPAQIPTVLYLDEADRTWHPFQYFKEKYKQDRPNREVKVIYPDGYTVANIEGAVPGAPGEVRVLFREKGSSGWSETNWQKVDGTTDFSTQVKLQELQPGTAYEIRVEAKPIQGKNPSASISGQFKTTVTADIPQHVQFMVTTCHEYDDQDDPNGGGFKIYKHMQALNPDFMVHTGDVIYYDYKAKTLPLAYWHWQRMFGLPNCVDYYRQVPCYFMKDDHDTWMNDCYPQSVNKFMGEFTFEQGVQVFKQQVPSGDRPYRTVRWGKDLQVWLMEGREFRTGNDMQDGPGKTIWGREQMDWFQRTLHASDATYRVLISATPIIGPDRPQKMDNHANAGFAYEGAVIRKFMAGHKNVFIVCGDRHWQYVSQDGPTGLMEFSCGPASNEHAGGWKKEDVLPEHHYLNITGGFLGVEVKREQGMVTIVFTHYSVDGEKLYSKQYQNKIA